MSSDGGPALTGDTANRSSFESSQQVLASLHGHDGFTPVAILIPLVAPSDSLEATGVEGGLGGNCAPDSGHMGRRDALFAAPADPEPRRLRLLAEADREG